MAAALQGVVVGGVGASPLQSDLVGVAVVTVDHGSVGIYGASLGDVDIVLGVTTVNGVGAVAGGGGVHLRQACLGHGDGHHLCIILTVGIILSWKWNVPIRKTCCIYKHVYFHQKYFFERKNRLLLL